MFTFNTSLGIFFFLLPKYICDDYLSCIWLQPRHSLNNHHKTGSTVLILHVPAGLISTTYGLLTAQSL